MDKNYNKGGRKEIESLIFFCDRINKMEDLK